MASPKSPKVCKGLYFSLFFSTFHFSCCVCGVCCGLLWQQQEAAVGGLQHAAIRCLLAGPLWGPQKARGSTPWFFWLACSGYGSIQHLEQRESGLWAGWGRLAKELGVAFCWSRHYSGFQRQQCTCLKMIVIITKKKKKALEAVHMVTVRARKRCQNILNDFVHPQSVYYFRTHSWLEAKCSAWAVIEAEVEISLFSVFTGALKLALFLGKNRACEEEALLLGQRQSCCVTVQYK